MILTSIQDLNVQQYSSKGTDEKIEGGVYQTTLYGWIRSFNQKVVFEYHNSYENSLKAFIAREISTIPEVEYIYCQREEHVYFVWILIDQLDQNVRREIYKKEREIIDLFHEEIFDFYVVARVGKPADSIITGPELIYYKK